MAGRRVHERFECDLAATLVFEGREISTVITNISLGGMFLETQEEIPYGSPVKVRFRLPALKEPTECDATVRWKADTGLGAQFGSLRALEVWALNQLFKSLEVAEDQTEG